MLFSVRAFRALLLGLRYDTFKIGGHHEAGSFLIDLGHAGVEGSSSERAPAAFLHNRGQILQLLRIWTGGKQIVLDPHVKLFALLLTLFGGGCSSNSRRIVNKENLRLVLRCC